MIDPFSTEPDYPVMARDEGFYDIFLAYLAIPDLTFRQAYLGAKRQYLRDKERASGC